MSDPEKDHIVEALSLELSKVETVAIRERMIDILLQIDQGLAHRVAYNVGVTVAGPAGDATAARARLQAGWAQFGTTGASGAKVASSTPAVAPELSMANTLKDSIKTRKIAILVGAPRPASRLSRACPGWSSTARSPTPGR